MSTIHDQLKNRRKELRLKQDDMLLRVGMLRQQYQRLESKGNPRLNTLELVAKGLKMELMLIPQEKLHAVRHLLDSKNDADSGDTSDIKSAKTKTLSDDPWAGILEE